MMGYDPYKVAEWYRNTRTKGDFVAVCVNEHNMKAEAAEDYWMLIDSVVDSAPTVDSGGESDAAQHSHDTIALKCEISEFLLGSYMADERKADDASAGIVAIIAQQRHS